MGDVAVAADEQTNVTKELSDDLVKHWEVVRNTVEQWGARNLIGAPQPLTYTEWIDETTGLAARMSQLWVEGSWLIGKNLLNMYTRARKTTK